MRRFGKSYTVQPTEIYLSKIKAEKYKSLEKKSSELKKAIQESIFDHLKYHIKEMIFDFILADDNTFKFLQVKDYTAIQISEDTEKLLRLMNRERKGLKQLEDCEGFICTFASNSQVEKVVNVLNHLNLLKKKYCTKGKVSISKKIINGYKEDLEMHRNLAECDNILGPLILSYEDKEKMSKGIKSIELFQNIEFSSVCDLCKLIYKIYSNKLENDEKSNKSTDPSVYDYLV